MIQVVGAMLSRQMINPQKLELVIAGMPTEDSMGLLSIMKRYVTSMGFSNSIRFDDSFIPFEKLPCYYGASDMTIHMVDSPNLSSSGSMRTDLSHGVPIIAMRSGMTMDIEGGICKVGNIDEMMSTLIKIAKNREVISELRREAASQ